MYAACLDHTNQPLNSPCTARAEAALKRDIAHAKSPQRSRETDGIRGIQEVHIGDDAVRSDKLERLSKALSVAARKDHLVHLSLVLIQDLINDIAFLIADDIRCAVFSGKSHAVGPCTNGEDPARTGKCGTRHSHQTDRTDTEYDHIIAIMDLSILDRVETRGHHVRRHQSILDGDIIGHHEQIGIRIIYMIQLREDAILLTDKLETARRECIVHVVVKPVLEQLGFPVGGHTVDDDLVAGLEILDRTSNLAGLIS